MEWHTQSAGQIFDAAIMTISMPAQSIFDQEHYVRHIAARGQFIKALIPALKKAVPLETALDAGCGLGFFADLLQKCGFQVRAFDGRDNNIDEARKRYPQIDFSVGDIEEKSIVQLGCSDLVLCFGLLYHLENPLRAIRHLQALTGKILLLETMCLPTSEPTALLRVEPDSDDQSLTDLAFYPSEGCIVKMLYHAGFKCVYRSAALPDHDDFRETTSHTRRRNVFVASAQTLNAPELALMPEPGEPQNPWQKLPSTRRRLGQYLAQPTSAKYLILAKRLKRRLPRMTVPIRLPFGSWWLARKDHVSGPILDGDFETSELAFVSGFLKPGMTVLDIGAHHGLYTLLASRRVGRTGKVFAFEPSPRERKALRLHLRINSCSNVTVQTQALGDENAEGILHVVESWAAGCNSLRPPDIPAQTSPIKVEVARLDDWLAKHDLQQVDFIKLDVEGAEFAVLRGATMLLGRRPRPVILAEVEDIRTAPWNYAAREIVSMLEERDYTWFEVSKNGRLTEMNTKRREFDANIVAIPNERKESIYREIDHGVRT
jgi:FkbM family methyltransferase